MSHLSFFAIGGIQHAGPAFLGSSANASSLPGPACETEGREGSGVDGSAMGQWCRRPGTETAAEREKDPGPLALASPLAGVK